MWLRHRARRQTLSESVWRRSVRGETGAVCGYDELPIRLRFLFKDRLLPHQRPSVQRVHDIVRQCANVERRFIDGALPKGLQGLNAKSMQQYVEFTADVMLGMMGLPMLYNVGNPYSWMCMLGLGGKQNFFEGRVSEYKRADVSGDVFQMDDVAF